MACITLWSMMACLDDADVAREAGSDIEPRGLAAAAASWP